MTKENLPGALVLSLDFELAWGVRDRLDPRGPYRKDLLGTRAAIPDILALFEEYRISATWAVVGFLFSISREELERIAPKVRPRYADRALDSYSESVGENENDDPLHFAPSLVQAIQRTP
ncbi:MAG: polysaccharide deacetylase, partial [Acidobacteria bacterium]|nr:polysaccharide deacetylase [Acidobacteriota bacterium]